jgi:hypothetical protein
MSGNTDDLKWKLEQMLTSNDSEWVHAVTTTLNALYRQFQVEQFQVERQSEKTLAPLGSHGTPTRLVVVVYGSDLFRC